MFLPLSDDRNLSIPGINPVEVLTEIRGVRSAESGGIGFAREIRAHKEAESLAIWADDRGLLSTRCRPPEADELTGGEHLVELEENTGRVFKSTLPGKYGFAVDIEMVHPKSRSSKPRITVGLVDATPDEYLARLAWQNGVFGDNTRVVGVVRYPQGLSVLTTQP